MNNNIAIFDTNANYNNFVDNFAENSDPNVSLIDEDISVHYIKDVNCIVAGTHIDDCEDARYIGTVEIGGITFYKWGYNNYNYYGEGEGDIVLTETRNPSPGDPIGFVAFGDFSDIRHSYGDGLIPALIYSTHHYENDYANIVYLSIDDGTYKKVNGANWSDTLGTPVGVEVISGDETTDGRTVIVDLFNMNNDVLYEWGGYTYNGIKYTYMDVPGLNVVGEYMKYTDNDGLSNTNKIISAFGNTLYGGKPYAAKVAKGYSIDGLIEWYLPSSGELLRIRMDGKRISSSLNVVGDGNFYDDTSCWSSTLTLRIVWSDVCTLGTNGVRGVPRYNKWNVRRFGRVFVKN